MAQTAGIHARTLIESCMYEIIILATFLVSWLLWRSLTLRWCRAKRAGSKKVQSSSSKAQHFGRSSSKDWRSKPSPTSAKGEDENTGAQRSNSKPTSPTLQRRQPAMVQPLQKQSQQKHQKQPTSSTWVRQVQELEQQQENQLQQKDEDEEHLQDVVPQIDHKIPDNGPTAADSNSSHKHHAEAIQGLVQAGDVFKAEQLLRRICDANMHPGNAAFNAVLSGHAKNNNLESAAGAFEYMVRQGVEANATVYMTMIRACASQKSGDVANAAIWFQKMIDGSVKPNAMTYCAMLNVCAKAGDADKAEEWFQKMQDDDIAPITVCYNCVIDACCKAGDPARAEQWLRKLKATSLRVTPPSYTTTAQAFASIGDYENTERIIMEMEDDGLSMDAFVLTVLLGAYAKAKPKLTQRAIHAFTVYAQRSLPVTKPPIRVMHRVVGKQRTHALCEELGVNVVDDKGWRSHAPWQGTM